MSKNKHYRSWTLRLWVLLPSLSCLPLFAQVAQPRPAAPAKKGASPKAKSVLTTPARTSPSAFTEPESGPSHWALMVQAGWASTYGNGLSAHWLYGKELDFHAGAGYNLSGLKAGLGANYQVPMGTYDLTTGASLVGSTGTSGDVSLKAKFQPEGKSSQEEVDVTKSYNVSSAFLLSLNAGAAYNLSPTLQLVGEGVYGLVLAGNKVSLGDKIEYSVPLDVTNEQIFAEEFNKKARETTQAGGLGFLLGVRFVIR